MTTNNTPKHTEKKEYQLNITCGSHVKNTGQNH